MLRRSLLKSLLIAPIALIAGDKTENDDIKLGDTVIFNTIVFAEGNNGITTVDKTVKGRVIRISDILIMRKGKEVQETIYMMEFVDRDNRMSYRDSVRRNRIIAKVPSPEKQLYNKNLG